MDNSNYTSTRCTKFWASTEESDAVHHEAERIWRATCESPCRINQLGEWREEPEEVKVSLAKGKMSAKVMKQ